MDTWEPITAARLAEIIDDDLRDCNDACRSAFLRYRVDPYHACIDRHGKEEMVYVVARNGNEVMYWEDIEDGFNISPVAADGKILEHWCNQDPLKWALKPWLSK